MTIQFLDINKFCAPLIPITSTIDITKNDQFHEDGLFSEKIFGPENSNERKKIFSYINLNCKVIHPSAYKLVLQLERKIGKMISTETAYSLDSNGSLIEDPEGLTGIDSFAQIFSKIKFRGETQKREKFIKVIQKAFKDKSLFIDKIIVLPPNFRNVYQDKKGAWIRDSLNDVYLNILRKSFQMKGVSYGSLYDLLNYNLQKAIIEHDDYIRAKIGKKEGLIRNQLLGKRIDFSARAVIAPGPDLRPEEIGLPLRMVVMLFETFIMRDLLYTKRVNRDLLRKEIKDYLNLEISNDSILQVLKAVRNKDDMPKSLYDIIWESAEIAIMNRVIIAKRDPVLHAFGLRSFYVKLIEGSIVRLSPLVVGGFNADFDGDQMAFFHPISDEAQKEARENMMRVEGNASSNDITFGLKGEMWAGLYMITKPIIKKTSPYKVTEDDLLKATDPYIPVIFKGTNMTMGMAIINNCFPPKFKVLNELLDKGKFNKLLKEVAEQFDNEALIQTASNMKDVGFKFATIMAPSISIDDLEIPESILKLKAKLKGSTPEETQDLMDQMQVLLQAHLKKNNSGLYDLIESGAGKGWGQPMGMLVAKGIVKDPEGNLRPVIDSALSEGMTNSQYFDASTGARSGIVDRTINTADTGYFARKLAYILNTVEASPTIRDCGTDRTLTLRLDNKLMNNLWGRYVLKNGKPELFIKEDYKAGQMIELRSPIYCRTRKVCATCYGRLLSRIKSPYIGIVAANTLGERGTQMIMVSFHNTAVTIIQRDMLGDIISNSPINFTK